FTAFAALLPTPAPRARVLLDDAAKLAKVEDASVDVVIMSPPSVAPSRYLPHHELLMRWLDLDTRRLAKDELGARRFYERLSPDEARASWERELPTLFTPSHTAP